MVGHRGRVVGTYLASLVLIFVCFWESRELDRLMEHKIHPGLIKSLMKPKENPISFDWWYRQWHCIGLFVMTRLAIIDGINMSYTHIEFCYENKILWVSICAFQKLANHVVTIYIVLNFSVTIGHNGAHVRQCSLTEIHWPMSLTSSCTMLKLHFPLRILKLCALIFIVSNNTELQNVMNVIDITVTVSKHKYSRRYNP